MKMRPGQGGRFNMACAATLACAANSLAADVSTNSIANPATPAGQSSTAVQTPAETRQENWNWHVQNTDIVQGYPAFPADYSGPNSLPPGGEARQTVSLDLTFGARLWRGAEAHVDGLMWQGYGLGHTVGIEAFPNGEAYRVGTTVPNFN
ncbi:MAG TPA: hypothetical protein VL970_13270, partial [Candidatus Acidoferrales bacterium]|nr:hypothetical protein [Candidatus Acidoferrales bacterium]